MNPSQLESLVSCSSRIGRSVSEFLHRMRAVELYVPHVRGSIPPVYRNHFSLGGCDGQLRSSSDTLALQSIVHTDCAFARRLEFRYEDPSAPNRLSQFTLFEVTCRGDYEAAIRFTESVFLSIWSQLCNGSPSGIETSAEFRYPFSRTTFEEASRLMGTTGDLNYEDQMRVLEHFQNGPLFVEKMPSEFDRDCFGFAILGGCSERFDLLLPRGGEVATGGLIETNGETFAANFRESQYYEKLNELCYEQLDSDVETRARLLNQLSFPCFRAVFSLERIAQFILDKPSIVDAVAFPVPPMVERTAEFGMRAVEPNT